MVVEIERERVLHGHVSPETAYVVDDYPYGSLRCTIRYWLEQATKGAKQHEWRFVSQTTNPKKPGQVWNKPHPGTYSTLAVMYLDSVGHVQCWGTGVWVTPEPDALTRLRGIYEQLTDKQRKLYDALVKLAQRNSPESWRRWEDNVADVAAHIRATGDDPVLFDGTWTPENAERRYIGDQNLAAYVAYARRRLATEGELA